MNYNIGDRIRFDNNGQRTYLAGWGGSAGRWVDPGELGVILNHFGNKCYNVRFDGYPVEELICDASRFVIDTLVVREYETKIIPMPSPSGKVPCNCNRPDYGCGHLKKPDKDGYLHQ